MMDWYIKHFDVEAFLDSRGVPYWTGGKNVTYGWINIACPFCSDHSNHCGISPDKMYSCWRCKSKGGIARLISQLESCSLSQANAMIKRFQGLPTTGVEERRARPVATGVFSVPGEPVKFLSAHWNYLERRGFEPAPTIKKYGLKAVGPIGNYKFRIVAPIVTGGRAVNFLARDITERSNLRYKQCPNATALIPADRCIYNIDSVEKGGNVVITEGITDVWNLGDGVVASLGVEFTHGQLMVLKGKELRNAFVMFDSGSEAIRRAETIAHRISGAGIAANVEVVELSEGDPSELPGDLVRKIRKEYLQSV